MGSNAFYLEERPARTAEVPPFRIDRAPVTNRQFAAFVEATGYTTLAETPLDPADHPGVCEDSLAAGSLVFRPPREPLDSEDWRQWWSFCPGANWRHPAGPGSSIDGLEDHPVVHVAHADALAYARWAGKSLPSEAMWEYAARGGHDDRREYAWGHELAPGGRVLANYWQGQFPHENRSEYLRTSPIGTYPQNPFGLHDMIGNVWEWTSDAYVSPGMPTPSACCGSLDAHARRDTAIVIKGGSHLCAQNYCRRYRPAARQGQRADSSTSHIGFRCVIADRPQSEEQT